MAPNTDNPRAKRSKARGPFFCRCRCGRKISRVPGHRPRLYWGNHRIEVSRRRVKRYGALSPATRAILAGLGR